MVYTHVKSFTIVKPRKLSMLGVSKTVPLLDLREEYICSTFYASPCMGFS